MSILEGEGLFNDVTAIVLYHVAIAAAEAAPSRRGGPGSISDRPPWSLVAIGLALGWAANKLMSLLGDATLQIGMTLLVPFALYVSRRSCTGRGCSPALTTALFLAQYATDADDVMTRLAGYTFWDVVDTLVTGVAFGLIGLEAAQRDQDGVGAVGRDAGWAAAIVAVVVFVRLAYLMLATWLTKRLHAKRDYDEEIPTSWRETVIMWWSGTAGSRPWPSRWPFR